MLKSNNKSAIQSQKWIINALLELMAVKKYDDITVSEICQKADLDRRTFYRNFDSKADLLNEYIVTLCYEYLNDLKEINELSSFNLAKAFFEFWKNHLDFIKNIQSCGLSNFVFNRFEKFISEHFHILTGDNINEYYKKYVLAYRIGGFWNIMLSWINDDAVISPEEMAHIFEEHC